MIYRLILTGFPSDPPKSSHKRETVKDPFEFLLEFFCTSRIMFNALFPKFACYCTGPKLEVVG